MLVKFSDLSSFNNGKKYFKYISESVLSHLKTVRKAVVSVFARVRKIVHRQKEKIRKERSTAVRLCGARLHVEPWSLMHRVHGVHGVRATCCRRDRFSRDAGLA